MKNLLVQQQFRLQELEKLKVAYDKNKVKSTAYCQRILSKIDTLHNWFEENHSKILSSLKGDDDELKSEYFTNDVHACFEDFRLNFETELQTVIDEAKLPQESDSSNATSNLSTGEVGLPRISVPKFYGRYEDWITFRDLFKSLIHERKTLANVQKIHYLKCSLGGEAEVLLKHLTISDANYDIAWRILCDRYDNKQILLNAQFKKLFNLSSATDTASSLKNLLDRTRETVKTIEAMSVVHLWEYSIVYLTAQRLPSDTRQLWEQSVSSTSDIPTLERLSTFIERRFRALEAAGIDRVKSKPNQATKQVNVSQSIYCCCLCKGKHPLRLCDQFKALDHPGKLDFVRQKGLCLNCLGFGHRAANCPSQKRCSTCNQGHHTLLHKSHSYSSSSSGVGIHSVNAFHKEVLLATAIVNISSPNGKMQIRALLDQGSQASLITESAVQLLGLRRKSSGIHITGINGVKSSVVKGAVNTQLLTLDGESITFNALILDRLTNLIPTSVVPNQLIDQVRDIQLADPEFYKPGRVDMLLGADMYAQLLLDGVLQLSAGSIAQRTKIGWIVSGEIKRTNTLLVQSCTVRVSEDENLNAQLKKFWELEEISSQRSLCEKDERCESHYQENTRRLENGRFEVSLPFKSSEMRDSLGHSRHIAETSFAALERRFSKDPGIKKEYVRCIEDYINSGHMVELQPQEKTIKGNYLPHHAVMKDSTSTKLRVVFDASRKTTSGVSLNDVLLTGPALQNDLNAILLRFRMFRYAYEADITKMFTQININSADSHFQRIVWRSSSLEHIRDYRLSTVTFGTTCAPFLAIRTLHQLANESRLTHPIGAQQIFDDFYVDDLLSGDDDLQQAIAKRKEVDELLKSGGFQLRKWLANDIRILDGVPAENIEMKESLNLDLDKGFKSLGIDWHPLKDYFSYHLNLRTRNYHTKRTILSDIATLYDPLGWIAPVIISAKIILQALWLDGCSWDEPLPAEIEKRWRQYRTTIDEIRHMRIPRWIPLGEAVNIELHGFSDASKAAYAAVVYLVIRSSSEHKPQIVMAKTKIAPIKPVTIPRLELCGAVLLAKLMKYVKEAHKFTHIQTWLWSDSSIVLSWLKGHPTRWSVFVANRTTEIYNTVGNTTWRHVPSQENPADVASRGTPAGELVNSSLWWNGPHWLMEDPDCWPKLEGVSDTDLERRKTSSLQCLLVQNPELDLLLNRFSSLTKLVRVTAYCLRFRNCTLKSSQCKGSLKADELKQAQNLWIKYIQMKEFPEEIKYLRAKIAKFVRLTAYCLRFRDLSLKISTYKGPLTPEELERAHDCWIRNAHRMEFFTEINKLHIKSTYSKGRLANLHPFLDANDVLRVGGRLGNSLLPFEERHPAIIPKHGTFTHLLLNQLHKATIHGQTQLMLSFSRRKYWIIDGRNAIRHFIHRCIICFKCKATTSSQLMGSLPSPRVTVSRPFTHTGIDYCGPFNIRERNGRGCSTRKGYIAIFICLTVKAIHIELVSDMTTASFIAALKRFMSRRGLCSDIYSDCGSNFVGADKELRDVTRRITKSSTVANVLATQEINWHFNPPAAPHFGGLWEAGVKSTKLHLRRIIGDVSMTFEELYTTLVQIEAVLNSRPLCPLNDDPTDESPLTPAHFLIGESLLASPQTDVTEIPMNRLSRWQLTQRLAQHFWKRWSTEYLQRLQQRPKWLIPKDGPKVGDLCLIKEDKIPPFKWPLARIEEVHPGPDSLVRVVTVRMRGNSFRRPVHKIAVLPIYETNN